MNFTINSKELLKAISVAGKALSNNATAAMYECLLFEADQSGKIKITGSDSSITIQCECKASEIDLDGQDGRMVVPFDLLYQTLTNLPNSPITLSHISERPNFRAELTYQTDLFNIPCEDSNVYFNTPIMVEPNSVKVNAGVMSDAIGYLIDFVSTDAFYPGMSGVNMKMSGTKIEFCATNALMIAIYNTENTKNSSKANNSIILPARLAKLVSESITDFDSTIDMNISDRFIQAQLCGATIYSTKIEESFPAYEGAIPVDFNYEAVIDSDALKMAIKRGNAFGDLKTNTASLRFIEKNLFYTVEDTLKNTKSNQDLEIESEIEDFTIGFNSKFLSKVLNKVNGPITLSMTDYNMGAVIFPKCADNEELKYLIMPVSLQR